MTIPQLLLTLDPEGNLVAELPGSQATRRQVRVRDLETIQRILQGQLGDCSEIGLDGAPTQAQVKHWEEHGIWASSACRFCLAEGRITQDPAKVRKAYTVTKEPGPNGVEVRRLKAGQSFRHKTLDTKRTIGDLDL